MPGIGQRYNGPGRRPPPRPVRPAPSRPAPPAAKPTINLRSTKLSSEPFKPAQQQAQHHVEQAQRALPPQPTPHLPRLPNPTPAQSHAALAIAQARAKGQPNYWHELKNDPRPAAGEYLATIEHYARAAYGHLAASEGRSQVGGRENAQAQFAPAALALARAEAVKIGRGLLAAPHAGASPAPAPKGVSLPLIGTVVPGRTLQGIEGTVASKVAEDLPQVEAAGSAIGKLATGNVGSTGPQHSIVHNALIDLSQLPAGTIKALVQTGAAGVQAAGGNTKPAETIISGLKQTLEHPLKALHERPVSTGLVLAGGEEAAGRLAGAVARTGALGKAVRTAASTDRAPLGLYNDMAVKRDYNPDPLRKGVEVAADKVRASRLLPEERRQLNPNQATGTRLQRAIKGGLTRPGEVDINVAGAEQLRRALRSELTHAVRSARPKHGSDAVPLIAERVIRRPDTVAADLQKEAARLKGEQAGLTGRALAESNDSLQRVEALLKDKRFLADPAPAFAAAEHYRETLAGPSAALERVGHLAPQAATRRPLFPYAIAHMGARYFSAADHQAAETAARAEERVASVRAAEAPQGSPERAAAVREAQLARANRWAVSGRGRPEEIAAHEGRLEAHAAARAAIPKAQEDLRRAEAARARLVGAQRSGRAREGMRASTAEERQKIAAATAKVDGRREALKAAQGRLSAAAKEAQGSRLPSTKPGLRSANGHYLPNEEILAHMRANGVEPPAFLSHESGLAGNRGAFYKSTARRPAGAKQATGESFRKGTYDRSYEALIAQAAKLGGEYASHHATDARLSRFGIGRFPDQHAAAAEAENFSHTPEGQRITNALGELVPTPIGRERVRASGLTNPGDIAAARERFDVQAHTAAPQADSAAEGKFTLLPRTVLERLQAHERLVNPSEATKLGQMVTNRFRQTALFTSPRWLLGNPQEHAIRLAVAGAAPKFLGGRSGRFGARIGKAYDEIALEKGLDAEAARLSRSQLVKATHYGAAEDLKIYRAADQFQSSPVLGPTMQGKEIARDSLPGRTVLKPWRVWHDTISKGMTALERESRRSALGRAAIRDIQRFNGKWRNVMSMTDEQVKAYARGTLKPSETAFLVKQVDEMMGAYGHLTPTVRSAVQTWSPFGLWWLTSMRYLRRLPIDHPTKTAIAAALHNAVASTEPQTGEETPGYLEGGIHANLPLGLGGATLQPTYYSPMGVAIEPLRTAASLVAPYEVETVGDALGLNTFTAKALTTPHGKKGEATEGQRPGIIASRLIENLVPGVRQATQLAEKGGTPYDTSNLLSPTIKPGTERDFAHALFKVLSPARFSYDKGAGRATGGSRTDRARERAARRASPAAVQERQQRAIERAQRRLAR